MAATAQPRAAASGAASPPPRPLARARGIELLGELEGSGYQADVSLVRRADGTVVKLGAIQYSLLACLDGTRDRAALAEALGDRLGKRVTPEHVDRIAQKLAAQALLAGTEDQAPSRPDPLLALRWKVVVSDPAVTARITRPFTWLFRPWLLWPVLLAFAATTAYVLAIEGVAGATRDAFDDPELLLLVFVLGVLSGGFHELGHAAASAYGGARPGAMGAGLYLVWPAFYTDVTGSYGLPRRDRLRVDLGGLHFNAVVAVATMAAWLVLRVDALLLLIGLQLLLMVRQLPPIIRADGYHVLADLTGVPDLYAHIGPTLRRLVPGRRHEPSALTGRARAIVTVWTLVTVPLLLALALGMLLLLPRLLATAWASGERFLTALPDQLGEGDVPGAALSVLRVVGVVLPVLGGLLLAQRLLRAVGGGAWRWSDGSAPRRSFVAVVAAGLVASTAWALWPSGQYEPIRARTGGTLVDLGTLVSSPRAAVRPDAAPFRATPPTLEPGRHLAVSMVPRGGATAKRPALLVVPGRDGDDRAVAIVTDRGPRPPARSPSAAPAPAAAAATGAPAASGAVPPTGTTAAPAPSATTAPAAPKDAARPAGAFTFELPDAPGEGDTQALAVGKEDGGVVYDIAYAVVTVADGAPVTNTNSAFALANCDGCTTVAVSFQVVLVVGQSDRITPINAAGALNVECPACTTIAIAQQLVLQLAEPPSEELLARLEERLQELDALPELGARPSGQALLDRVEAVRRALQEELDAVREEPADDEEEPSPAPARTATTPAATTPAATTPAATTPGEPAPATTTPSTTAPASTAPAAAPAGAPASTTTPPATTAPASTTTAPATSTAPATATAPPTTSTTGTAPAAP